MEDPTEDLPASAGPTYRRPIARHWTKFGTLEIRLRTWLGDPVAALYLDKRFIQHYSGPYQAAKAAGLGDLNRELGFDAVAEGVPTDHEKWRDPLAELDRLEDPR